MEKNITFSTCWYLLHAKFDANVYSTWIDNMISCVNNYCLVIYTDELGLEFLNERFSKYLENPNIKTIIKPMESFYNYKYKDNWIRNHANNPYLNTRTEWKLHMLWSEKTHFVNETAMNKYFDTEFYGWCDIGYFRDFPVPNFPSNDKIVALDKNKIYYAQINNYSPATNALFKIIQDKNEFGLPKIGIPPAQVSIAGGFFVSHKTKIEWWKNTFNSKLKLYFEHDCLVKDDQIIVIDCIFSDIKHFFLVREVKHDPIKTWFLFQRYLV